MNRYRFLSSVVVTAAVFGFGSGQSVVGAQERAVVKAGPVTLRVYDRAHKDYHAWDDQEDRSYRQYLQDRHQTYRPIQKLSKKQQTTYWNSRHSNERR